MLIDLIIKREKKDLKIGNFRFYKKNGLYFLLEEKQWTCHDVITNEQFGQLYSSFDLAYGDCILSGLGFGILPSMLLKNPKVKNITVYENSSEVIEMNVLHGGIPERINVINQPIQSIKNVKCDCLLFDHFELESLDDICKDMRQVVSDNNPELVWFWRLEREFNDKYKSEIENNYDMCYADFLKELNIPKIPYIEKEKMKEYIKKFYSPFYGVKSYYST